MLLLMIKDINNRIYSYCLKPRNSQTNTFFITLLFYYNRMSTEIKNTLFRFVTMRAPELLEEEKIQQKFVKHPEAEKEATETFESVFLQAANHKATGKTRQQSIQDALTQFTNTAITKKDQLYKNEIVSKPFYDFATWLTANRNKLTAEEFQEKIGVVLYPPGGGDGSQTSKFVDPLVTTLQPLENVSLIWDNLFYQILSGKSAYVREMLLSLLVADFALRNYQLQEITKENVQLLAQARVIIPKLIFEKEATETASNTSDLSNAIASSKVLDTDAQIALANDYIEEVQKTLTELKRAQKIYNRKTAKAYALAKKEYDTTVAALYANAENNTTERVEGETTSLLNIVIPPFEFEKDPELDTTVLSNKVSAKSMEIINHLVEGSEIETFEEVYETLSQNIDSATQYILENTTTSQSVVVNNGLLIPTSNSIVDPVFSIGGNSLSMAMPLTFVFSDAVNNADVVSASYTLTFDDETTMTQTSVIDSIVNGRLTTKIFLNPAVSFLDSSSFTIEGVFTLNNGYKIHFSGAGSLSENFAGGAKLPVDSIRYYVTGNGNYTLEEIKIGNGGSGDGGTGDGGTGGTGTGGSSSSTTTTYIPSGFGVKRMGIADYRKVEQEVCCYVPGEVSHIENIMAREYKEKASRRLRRSENTTTSSTETEREKLTDTTSTERFEMNSEVASVINEDTSMGAHGDFHWGAGKNYGGSIGADFAHNTSSEESNNQALTHAKDVTERALDRVVQKVKEERISKVVEEFEETNKHGFDNTKGDKHVSGVYRWVDKVYRNKVINYGKRLMYEFMIPEPAAFHKLAATIKNSAGETLVKPVDPRNISENTLAIKSIADIDWMKAAYWAKELNATIEKNPEERINFPIAFSEDNLGLNADDGQGLRSGSKHFELNLPEKYQAIAIKGKINAVKGHFTGIYTSQSARINIGNEGIPLIFSSWLQAYVTYPFDIILSDGPYVEKIPVSVAAWDVKGISGNLIVKCELTPEAYKEWQIKTFNAIIAAYELKLDEYNQKLTSLKSEIKATNPGFYRQIENNVLRKNAIEYMASHDKMGEKSFVLGDNIENIRIDSDNPALEEYSAKVKFFEQAFEWNLMSYFFYPYYWSKKSKWQEKYNVEEYNDPLFRAFLQSGMARVIVTVRPGFEEAVNWYMATGQVWNGGQVPTMDDPMFVSIIEELREKEGEVEETWETRVPTSLTVIQAGSIGLNVEGLPCDDDCKDYKLFDSDGQVVLQPNGKPVSTNPIVRNLDEDGNDVVLMGANAEVQTPPIVVNPDPVPTSEM